MKRIIIPILFIAIFNSCNNTNGSGGTTSLNTPADVQSYEDKVMSIEETEKANPTNFLNADGTYKENFWGDKFKINGHVTSSATVAKYKDIQIQVIFYSKTNTELERKIYTLYEWVKPGRTVNFEWKIDKPNGAVKKIGWDVISATTE